MAENYWGVLDHEVVTTDDFNITLAFSTEAGAGQDISSWTFVYAAVSKDPDNTDTIDVADGAMTKSNSGSGVTDTVTIPLAAADTDVTPGQYKQEIRVTVGGLDTTIFRGTLKMPENVAVVA